MKTTGSPDPSETAVPPAAGDDLLASLERNIIEAYLHNKGYSLAMLKDLPAEQAHQLMVEASREASARLAEMESRAHMVNDIHQAAHAATPHQGENR